MGTDREEALRTFLDDERQNLALKRCGKPEQVTAAIAFLCSDQATFVVGSSYRVNGDPVATKST